MPLKLTLMGSPPQRATLGTAFTVGTWPKLIWNDWLAPTQPLRVGVNVIMADWALPPGVWLTKEMPAPLPLAGKPMFGLLLTHAYCAPEVPLKLTAILSPTQWFSFAGAATLGVGFTVTVKLIGCPLQPLSLGTTVRVETEGVLTALDICAMAPEPLAGKPVAVLLFVQL